MRGPAHNNRATDDQRAHNDRPYVPALCERPVDKNEGGRGSMRRIQVGDGVTASCVYAGQEIRLHSHGGTLWNRWAEKAKIDRDKIYRIKVEDRNKGYTALSHCGAPYIDRLLPIDTIKALEKEVNSDLDDLYIYIGSSIKKESYIYDKYPSWDGQQMKTYGKTILQRKMTDII